MSKYKVTVELRSKETLIIEAGDDREAESLAIDMADPLTAEVWDTRIEQLADDDAREADNA
jgi:hypothetical protein